MAQVKLSVKSNYVNRNLAYREGQEILVDEAEAAFLMADAPGNFTEVVEEAPEPEVVKAKAPKKPAKDKAVKESETK